MIIAAEYVLRETTNVTEFESWVNNVDMPLIRSTEGVERFEVGRVDGADRAYLETIQVTSMAVWDELSKPDVNPEHKKSFSELVDEDSVRIVLATEVDSS